MGKPVTMLLIGGPYDGQSFTGIADADVGEPTEFGLTAGDWQYLYRVNEVGEWRYFGMRHTRAFVSVEEIDPDVVWAMDEPPALKDVVRSA